MAQAHRAEFLGIDHGEAGREQLAIDHAFAQARNDAEADALRQLGQRIRYAAHVARLDMLQAVAQHDPVDLRPIGAGALLARVPDQLE